MRKNEKGFTLVELIVVIAIVAILAAVGIVGYTQFIQNARETAAQSELDQVVNVLRTCKLLQNQ
jgi:type IV pilus assembly protein PilA